MRDRKEKKVQELGRQFHRTRVSLNRDQNGLSHSKYLLIRSFFCRQGKLPCCPHNPSLSFHSKPLRLVHLSNITLAFESNQPSSNPSLSRLPQSPRRTPPLLGTQFRNSTSKSAQEPPKRTPTHRTPSFCHR